MKEKDNPQKENLGTGTALCSTAGRHKENRAATSATAGGWVFPQAHDEETPGMESFCARALWQMQADTRHETSASHRAAPPSAREPVFMQTSPDVALGGTRAKGALAGRGSAEWKWVRSQRNG